MERITSAVKQELSRFGAQGGMPELVEAWPEVVGQMVAANVGLVNHRHDRSNDEVCIFGDANRNDRLDVKRELVSVAAGADADVLIPLEWNAD